MWRDFERSVDYFVEYLPANDARRAVVLQRFRGHARSVEFFRPSIAGLGATVYSFPKAQSVTGSQGQSFAAIPPPDKSSP
jgi:hypothetical protein